MAATDPSACTARTQALCWLLDDLLDAEDDLLELMARPGALTGWRRERLREFCQRVGEGLSAPMAVPLEWLEPVLLS